jgi:hypothetical protein
MTFCNDLLDILGTFGGEQGIDRDQAIRIPRAHWNKVIFRRDHGPGWLEADRAARVSQSASQEQVASLILRFGVDAMQYEVKKSMYVSLIYLPTSQYSDRRKSLDGALHIFYLHKSHQQRVDWF